VIRRGFTGGHRHYIKTLSGGKSAAVDPARRIMQATEALLQIATSPPAAGMALTVHLGDHLQIRGMIWRGAPED